MSYLIESFGANTLPYYKAKTGVGSGAYRHVFVPLQSGGFYDALGSGDSPPGDSRISKACAIVGTTAGAVDTQYNTWLALGGTRNQLWRRRADGTREWCWARLSEIRSTREKQHLTHLDLEFVFLKLSPRWYAETETDLTYWDVGADDEDLATLHAESATTATLYGISNDGNVDQFDVTFTVTATFGNVTALTITNTTTVHALTFGATINATKALVIDCGAKSVLNDGAGAYANLTPPANKEEWMVFTPGVNVITIAVTGGPATVEIEFYDAWA